MEKIIITSLTFTFWKIFSKIYCTNHHQSYHKGFRIKDGDIQTWICGKCGNLNKIVKDS